MLLRDAFSWLCDNNSSVTSPCTKADALFPKPWSLQGHNISYCLSQPVTETCELQFSTVMLVIVIICNLIKCITMLLMLWRASESPLVTLGDCIATYLKKTDDATTGMCLLNKEMVAITGEWESDLLKQQTASAGEQESPELARCWDFRRRFWFAAASAERWIIGTIM